MMTQIRSELLKLVTIRTGWLFALSTLALVGFMVGVQAVTAGGEMLPPLSDPATQHELLTTAGIAALITAVFGALVLTTELRHQTIVPTLLAAPHRPRVVAAKGVAAVIAGTALGLVAVVTAAVGTTIVLATTGTAFVADTAPIGTAWAGTLIGAGLASLFGFGVGAVLRNQALAIGGLLILMLVVEPIVGQLVPDLAVWLPTGLTAVLGGAAEGPAMALSVLALAAYGVATSVAGAVTLRRIDLT